MTIRFSEPPVSSSRALERAMLSLEAPSDRISFLKTARPSWTMPHEVYHLGLDAVESRRGIDAAEPVAWRYLSDPDTPASTAADIRVRTGEHEFAGLTRGPFVHAFAEAVQRLAGDPAFESGDFEPRLLQVPALYVVALWLKERDSSGDVFIPLPPANSAVEPGRRYYREQFEAALVQAASKMRRPPPNIRREPGTEAP
jgi:hypothetical protein